MRRIGLAVAASAVLMALACGSGGSVPTPTRSKHVSAPTAEALPAPGAHTVPPDRALIPVSVTAGGDDYGAAASALRQRIDRLSAAGAEGGCEVRTLDYAPPTLTSWRAGLTATADLVADLPLAGLTTVAARMDRLDACRMALEGVDLPTEERAVGPASLRVDAPEASFDLLAERFAEEQARAASTAGQQSHPEDRRCVPTGSVRVGQARLSGVQVSLDVECRIAPGWAAGA